MMILRGWLAAGRWARLWKDQSGQAMVEYSTITFFILAGGAFAGFSTGIPELGGQTIVQALYSGLQTYVDSVFYCLSLGVT